MIEFKKDVHIKKSLILGKSLSCTNKSCKVDKQYTFIQKDTLKLLNDMLNDLKNKEIL